MPQLAASGLICFANSSRRRALLPCWSILAPPRPTVSERRSKRQRKRLASRFVFFEIGRTAEIEAAVAAAVAAGAGALLIGTGTLLFNNRVPIVESAARHAIPAMYTSRESVEAGGLVSYGASLPDAFHQAGLYAGRILKGEKPGDLPVIQSVKFDFMINLRTAKTLGLQFHPQLLATADEVIE